MQAWETVDISNMRLKDMHAMANWLGLSLNDFVVALMGDEVIVNNERSRRQARVSLIFGLLSDSQQLLVLKILGHLEEICRPVDARK